MHAHLITKSAFIHTSQINVLDHLFFGRFTHLDRIKAKLSFCTILLASVDLASVSLLICDVCLALSAEELKLTAK